MLGRAKVRFRKPLVMAEGLRAASALRRRRGAEVEVPKDAAEKLAAADPEAIEPAEGPAEKGAGS